MKHWLSKLKGQTPPYKELSAEELEQILDKAFAKVLGQSKPQEKSE